jgi:hypothetical protein
MRYTYKVWVADGNEHFEYGNEQKKKKDLPFGTSLMELLYLDVWAYSELFEGIGKAIMELYSSKEQRYADEVLAARHDSPQAHLLRAASSGMARQAGTGQAAELCECA